MSTAVFSSLLLPWPTRRHLHADAYRYASRDILIGAGMIDGDPDDPSTRRFEGVVVLDPYVYPYAADLERLLLAGGFNQWLFFLDDRYDDDPAFGRDASAVRRAMEEHFAILSAGRPPAVSTPYARFTAHLGRRLALLSMDGWLPRFLGHVEEYLFKGSLPALELWAQDRVPELEEYLVMRMYDSAVFAALDIIEIAAGIRLTDEARAHPALVEMAELTVRHVAYVNDLFSYQKEVLRSGTPCNLVRVLMRDGRASFAGAVSTVVSLVNGHVARFLVLERSLPSFGPGADAGVLAYVEGMKSWMRGNVDFSLASRRYRAPDSPFSELRGPPPAPCR